MRRFIIASIVALLASTAAGCGGAGDDAATSARDKVTHTFTFEATATGSDTIEHVNAGMDISEEGRTEKDDAPNPFRHEVTAIDYPESMIPQLIVRNLISGGGSMVTCRILMDGKEIANETEEGVAVCRVQGV